MNRLSPYCKINFSNDLVGRPHFILFEFEMRWRENDTKVVTDYLKVEPKLISSYVYCDH